MKKRLLSLLLALAMLLSLVPVTAMAGGENTISEVEVWGLDVPVVGEEPDREARLIGDPGYTVAAPDDFTYYINGIRWYDVTDESDMLEGDVFQAGHQYKVTIGLKANDGYTFDSYMNMSATTNLADRAYTGAFFGADASQYITVTLGSTTFPIYLTPKHRSSVTVTNGVAYNDDGEVITEALEGETVTVEGVPPVSYYAFKGWTVETTETLEGFDATSYRTSFTMPATDVVISGNYEDDEDYYALLNYAFVNLDRCVIGQEADFTPSNAVGETVYSGYHFVAPNRHDASKFYNGVCWRNTTNDTFLAPGDVFEEGNEYCVYVCIATDGGFLFSEDLTTSLNYVGECNNYEDNDVDPSKGRIIQSNPIKPVAYYNISVTNGEAYNDDGEVITKALPGENVTVKGVTPSGSNQIFEGWTVETPDELEDLWVLYEEMMFTMPASDVVIVGDYEDIVIYYAFANLDQCAVGMEADFTPTNVAEETEYPGYQFYNLDCLGTDVCYNGVAWWDVTDQTFLRPGDVFERDHTYIVYVGIAAKAGYAFGEDMTTSINHVGECGNYEDADIDPTKGLMLRSHELTPVAPYAINLLGATAYDKDGNVITEAMPYTLVTLVADTAEFGWKFDGWQVMGEEVLDLDDPNAKTTTFIMPEHDVTIFAGYTEAEKVAISQVEIDLYGYFIGANVNCIQVETSHGVVPVTNSTTNLDYVLCADNNGMPNTTPITSGRIFRNTNLWMGVILEPEFGYTLDGLTAAQITCSHGTAKTVSTNASGQTIVFVLLDYAPSLNSQGGAHTISVTNGTAYVNNTAITSTVSNVKVRLVADEAPAGQFFSHWQGLDGLVLLGNLTDSTLTFVVGTSDVEAVAVYKNYIYDVALEVTAPQADMYPSYEVTIDPEAGYEADTSLQSEYFINGIAWMDIDTEKYLVPNVDLFEMGHTYELQVQLTTKGNYRFAVADDYPIVSGVVNGALGYVDQCAEDSTKTVLLTYAFYLDPASDPIVVANIGLDNPMSTRGLDYSPMWESTYYHVEPYLGYEGENSLNGITWTDITDPNAPVVMDPVNNAAQSGHTYRVDVVIKAVDGRIFSIDENGNPNVTGNIGPAACEFSVIEGLDPTEYLMMSATMTPYELIKWVGTQLQATSNLDMQFALRVSDFEYLTGCCIILSRTYADGRDPDDVIIPQSKWTASGNFYIVAYSGLAAKEMGDVINATVYDANGNVISETRSESIVTYSLSMLGKITNAEQKTMFVDMLNYGAEAQKFFGYNTSNLANAGLTDAQKALATQEDIEVADHRVKGVNFYGSNLSLENVILLQMAFKVAPAEGMYAIASYTNHNGKEVEEKLEVIDNNGYSMVSVNSLAIADYCTMVTVNLYDADGNVVGSAADSMASYVARSKTDLGKAIMKFGASAYAYFH